jgi:hypothetical protein
MANNLFDAEHRQGFTTLATVARKLKELKDQGNEDSYQRYLKKIYDGTKYLLGYLGFPLFGNKININNDYAYSTTQSPRFPNAMLLRLFKKTAPTFIHDVAFIKFPNKIVEYYNPNGRDHFSLPQELQDFISEQGKYQIKEYTENVAHQDKDIICTRHSLVRGYYDELSNPEYDKVIRKKQTQFNLPTPADVIWNMTQNTLASRQKPEYVFKGGQYSERDRYIVIR